jgi:hypothetical protein
LNIELGPKLNAFIKSTKQERVSQVSNFNPKMPAYKYKARDKSGKAIDGVMEASSSETVAGHLV